MRRAIKSKIEYYSIDNQNKVVRAWNKTKAAKKLNCDISTVRENKTYGGNK